MRPDTARPAAVADCPRKTLVIGNRRGASSKRFGGSSLSRGKVIGKSPWRFNFAFSHLGGQREWVLYTIYLEFEILHYSSPPDLRPEMQKQERMLSWKLGSLIE